MKKKYVIQWQSTVNGRAGRGTKLFDKEEADRLAEELNQEYPRIRHQVVEAAEPREAPAEPAPENPAAQPASHPAPLLSVG